MDNLEWYLKIENQPGAFHKHKTSSKLENLENQVLAKSSMDRKSKWNYLDKIEKQRQEQRQPGHNWDGHGMDSAWNPKSQPSFCSFKTIPLILETSTTVAEIVQVHAHKLHNKSSFIRNYHLTFLQC